MKWGQRYRDTTNGAVCKYYPLHQGQLDILQSNARFLAALGGVGSGKTSLGMVWLMAQIHKQGPGPTNQYLIAAPNFRIVNSSTFEALKKELYGTILEGQPCQQTNNPHYKLGSGYGTVYFVSGEAPFDGLKPVCALADEFGNVPLEVFNAVKRRLDGRSGRLLITTTPYPTYDWIITEIMQRADAGDTNYFYRSFPSFYNPAFSAADYEEAKLTKAPWELDCYYHGKFTAMPGKVYDLQDGQGKSIAIDHNLEQLRLGEASSIVGAIDWGGSDPTAILVAALMPNQDVVVFWESYKTQQDIGQVINTLLTLEKQLDKVCHKRVQAWFCDHRPENNRALVRAGLMNVRPVIKGPGSIPAGISLVRTRIRASKLHVCRTQCPNLLREAGLYRYPCVDGRPVGDKPCAGNDHCMDAISYLIRGIDKKEFAKLSKYTNGTNETEPNKWL